MRRRPEGPVSCEVVDRCGPSSPGANRGGMTVRFNCRPGKPETFFDIVDYDEGTCGRRRLRLGSFGLDGVV